MHEASGQGVEHEADAAGAAPLASHSPSTRARVRTVVRVAVSLAVMAAYFAGVSLALDHPKDRVLFQLPATLLLVAWFFVMLVHEYRPRRDGAGEASRRDTAMRSVRTFRWAVATFSIFSVCVIASVLQPSWSWLLSGIGFGAILTWSFVIFVAYLRGNGGSTPPAAE
ncbi:hypothetical protein SRABI76_03477 [Microbacterium oxydans]|uniref:hypothetical protein n=1 Tax=Microbacterium oxydans TaxID=82380 RepID=UPI001E14BC7B|nr:hypothetical protein [Microbacterium oxydans]CAH0260589.1 hypothetical protein SRABI76_03477 [Microbacterium oxydans]